MPQAKQPLKQRGVKAGLSGPNGSGLKSTTKLAAKTPLKTRTRLTAKTPVAKKPKAHTVSWYKKRADEWWSRATRYRFAEKRDGEYWAECITCNTPAPIKKLQCGHFMSRGYNSTRFMEQNTAPQCYGCNVMHQGRQYEFGMALDALYGDGTAKAMHDLAKQPHPFTKEELQEIINDCVTEVAFYEQK